MNRIVFGYALPVMLFRDIAGSNFSEIFDAKLLVYAVVTTLVIFAASWMAAIIFIKDRSSIGVFVQGCTRSNYAIIGLPLIANVLGGANTGKGAVITTFVVPLYNVMSVIVLSIYSGKIEGRGNIIKESVINIWKNPLIRGILVGLIFSAFKIKLPTFLSASVNNVASLTTPLALLTIGAGINFEKMRARFKPAATAAVIKLVLSPLIFVPLAVLLNMRGEPLVVLYVMYASPAAVASYIMAQSMGGDEYLASNIVLLTTLASVFTFTCGIFLLKQFGLI